MDAADARVRRFAERLGLPEPADDADAMLDAVEERHGEAAVEEVLRAFDARSDTERYRRLLADPALAVEVTWRYAGAATAALLGAIERSGVLDGVARVLDLGSAEGVVPAYVAWSRPGTEVLATDLRPESQACVRWLAGRLGLARLRAERLSLHRVPARLRTRDWDVVLALRVLHEVDAVRVLRAIGDVVAPGGAVVVAERAVGEPDLARAATLAADTGFALDPAGTRLVPVRELDAGGAFPLHVLRPRGAAPAG